jgi:hypothetical protein
LGCDVEGLEAEALDGGKDVVGGFGPAEELWVGVDGVEVGSDRGFIPASSSGRISFSVMSGKEADPSGHIVGPGWTPLKPAGHFNPNVFTVLAKGKSFPYPISASRLFITSKPTTSNVHARDCWLERVRGEAFHAVSPAAITLRGYAEAMAARSGREPELRYMP